MDILFFLLLFFKSEPDWIGKKAPELMSGVWLNSKPLSLEAQRGKVILLQFWTFGCYNCKNTLPFIKDYYDKYEKSGLIVIGVHTPEFDYEKSESHVRAELKNLGIEYPVVMDNDYKLWRNYRQQYWPCLYLIDKKGVIRYVHIGEGSYSETNDMIAKLISE
jgi:thiol-disulfide isomerase/thioredoxin